MRKPGEEEGMEELLPHFEPTQARYSHSEVMPPVVTVLTRCGAVSPPGTHRGSVFK